MKKQIAKRGHSTQADKYKEYPADKGIIRTLTNALRRDEKILREIKEKVE